MTTDVIYADTTDGRISSSDATYTTARAGAGLAVNTTLTAGIYVGQNTGFLIYESFFQFNTSGVGTDTVSAAVLSLYGQTDSSTTDFVAEARVDDWGASLTTADWVAGASLSGLTLVAHYDTAGGWPTNAYTDFADDAFPANVNKTGQTLILVNSSLHRIGTQPSGIGIVRAYSADNTGTTNDPKLTVTHAAAAGDTLVQPGPSAVTVGTATATIVAQNWPKAAPAAAAVAIAGVAPTVAVVLVPVLVQPVAAAITVAAVAPAIVAQNWPRVSPAAGAITVATATPAVVAQNWPKVQPAAAAIGIAGATPALVAQNWPRVQPGAAAVAVAGATPAVAAGGSATVQPAPGAVSIAGATPAVLATANAIVKPAAAAVSVAGATPAIAAHRLVQPAAAAVTITTATPAVAAAMSAAVSPAPAEVTITGATPTVVATGVIAEGPSFTFGRQVRRLEPDRLALILADDEEILSMLYAA